MADNEFIDNPSLTNGHVSLVPDPSTRNEEAQPPRISRLRSVLRSQFGSRELGDQPKRVRILALGGARSNREVTRLRMENLQLSEDVYNIDYLDGEIEVEEGDKDLSGLVHGPFYSWLDEDEAKVGKSLVAAVHKVLLAVHKNGPYDGIYGFSNGGIIAFLAANIVRDPSLQDAIENFQNEISTCFNYSFLDASIDFIEPPFKFIILACAGASNLNINNLRQLAGLLENSESSDEEEDSGREHIKSFHIIGVEDKLKEKSEEICNLFRNSRIIYKAGGHHIDRTQLSDDELISELKIFVRTLGLPDPKPTVELYTPVSEVTSIGLHTNRQIAEIELKNDLLPQCLHSRDGGATIIALMKAQSATKPLFYNARNTDISNATTYGDLFNFIQGGEGDLRQLNVKQGEVVAYAAPPGGSAAAAVAFLSIGAQTAAAPLAPNMMAPDVLDALDQFKAKHLILFEGLDTPGIEEAFLKYANDDKATIHRASIMDDSSPGLFKFVSAKVAPQTINERRALRNPAKGVCLLLRTSGTTARPKGVPLLQGALVTNGAIIAKSMQLKESDVCYSVMPLFHIGGISASIMCTMASGGSVSCDSEPFDPGRMVDALALSNPQPTWYSSVPTIHNSTVNFLKDKASKDPKYMAYGISENGIWKNGHSLRMIRSGAAALLGPDGDALHAAYGGIPIYPTYSMSEQMPISQPPAGKLNTLTDKPGSVGVPVAASTAIVSRSTLRPQPFGVEGEIAISGPTVLEQYLNNPSANMTSYFLLTLPDMGGGTKTERYFLTGDVGILDNEGFLSLKGRTKELIKKGGEQISPYEVEEALLEHPWINTPICFATASKIYGEEVGCALILSPEAPAHIDIRGISKAMRQWLKYKELAPAKWPSKWVICNDSDLPKTKTKKYIRIGLAEKLGLDSEDTPTITNANEIKERVDWGVISGFRFILTCYVMFMHIGSNRSWANFNNLRGFPWHVHVFFTLGGFSMASPMNPPIKKKLLYFRARIWAMYPMYLGALILSLTNLIIVCRPSTFQKEFHWDSQPNDHYLDNGNLAPLFCEGTPATPSSYWASLFLTIFTHIFGVAVTPFWPFTWWMGYYLWFISMYYQCLAMFPIMYNFLYNRLRRKTCGLIQFLLLLIILNYAIILLAWFSMKDGVGYNHYNTETGDKNSIEIYKDGKWSNILVISFYLSGPFWIIYFFIGAVTAFLYDAYRPTQRHNAFIWGWIADTITLCIFAISIAIICQGTQNHGEEAQYMRPHEADDFTDVSSINRLWDNLVGRITCPLTTLWIFSLSTGNGYTAAILRDQTLTGTLAPNAYNCFLFHQMVGQWYFAATRNGHMWNWWRYRKIHYWFSPAPCPVEWYEYPLVVGCVVVFSRFMDNTIKPLLSEMLSVIMEWRNSEDDQDNIDTEKLLISIIEGMTGIEPKLDYTLDECGLASIGISILVASLNKKFSTKKIPLEITTADLISAKTIADMVEVIKACKARADEQGV